MKKVLYLANLAVVTASVWGGGFTDRWNENQGKNRFVEVKVGDAQIQRMMDMAEESYAKHEELYEAIRDATPGEMFDEVKRVIEQGDLSDESITSAINQNHGDVIFLVISKNAVEILRYLVKKGADVNATNEQGVTVLQSACLSNNKDMVRFLLRLKDKDGNYIVNINGRAKEGSTAIHYACRLGYVDIVKELLTREDLDVNAKNQYGYTALIRACVYEHHDVVKFLLRLKDKDGNHIVDINLKDNDGRTALHYACQRGFKEVVKLLLGRKCINVNKEDSMGHTPLYIACESGYKEIVELLKKSKKATAPRGKRMTVKGLQKIVSDRNKQQNEDGKSQNKANSTGSKRQQNAKKKGNENLGSSYNMPFESERIDEKDRKISFVNAAGGGNLEQVQNLIENGGIQGDQETCNEAFQAAAGKGCLEIVEFLLDYADINGKDSTGNTVLMLAAQNGHLEVVGDLVANGATIDVNNKGYTALRFAAENGHADVVEYLLDAGARTKYLDETLNKVKEKIAQNDSPIEDYKRIQEVLSGRQQVEETFSEKEVETKTWNVLFWNKASKDYNSLDENLKKEIDLLLGEIQKNPFERRKTPGQKPEPLYGNLRGFFSRRINGEHRLVYRISGDNICVVACNDHYEDLNTKTKSELRNLTSFNQEWNNGILVKVSDQVLSSVDRSQSNSFMGGKPKRVSNKKSRARMRQNTQVKKGNSNSK
ncbi:MAG: Txe/YoeB family addiction module toxin [Alphaproteobacteria bacterium]|nr:Txe/YoeB family addiction module toxin [Alphaproteobacteria bacterium]